MMAAIELAKALRKSEALAADHENQIAELQAGLDQAELDGRQGGLEAAALYHDSEAATLRMLVKDEPKDAWSFLSEIATHEQDARNIRALKEPTP